MERTAALRIVVLAVAAGVLLTVLVVGILVVGQPIRVSGSSIAALAAWSAYATAAATLLLVVVAIVGGLEARGEFRAGHRPVPTLGGGRFLPEGVEILIGNVGPGAIVNLHLRVWISFAAYQTPEPRALADAIERAATAARIVPPFFEADLVAIAPSSSRIEVLRFGPAVNLYDPEWAFGWGVIMWDAEATDLFGEKHPGSGYLLTEGETLTRPF